MTTWSAEHIWICVAWIVASLAVFVYGAFHEPDGPVGIDMGLNGTQLLGICGIIIGAIPLGLVLLRYLLR
jgi:hypothetical protein